MKSSINLQYATIIYQQYMTCNCNILPLENYFSFQECKCVNVSWQQLFLQSSIEVFNQIILCCNDSESSSYWFCGLDPESPQTLPINKEHTLSFILLITFTFPETSNPSILSEVLSFIQEFLCSYWAYIMSITCK